MYLKQEVQDEERTTDSLLRDLLALAVFDPGRVLREFAILDYARRSGKDYAAEARSQTLPVVLKHEWDRVQIMAQSVCQQPWLARLGADPHAKLMLEVDAAWAPSEEDSGVDNRLQLTAVPHLVAQSAGESAGFQAVAIVKSVPRLHGWEALVRKTGWDLEVTFDTIAAGLYDPQLEGDPAYLSARPYLILVEDRLPHRTQVVPVDAAHVVATMLRRLWRTARSELWCQELHTVSQQAFHAGHTDGRLQQLA